MPKAFTSVIPAISAHSSRGHPAPRARRAGVVHAVSATRATGCETSCVSTMGGKDVAAQRVQWRAAPTTATPTNSPSPTNRTCATIILRGNPPRDSCLQDSCPDRTRRERAGGISRMGRFGRRVAKMLRHPDSHGFCAGDRPASSRLTAGTRASTRRSRAGIASRRIRRCPACRRSERRRIGYDGDEDLARRRDAIGARHGRGGALADRATEATRRVRIAGPPRSTGRAPPPGARSVPRARAGVAGRGGANTRGRTPRVAGMSSGPSAYFSPALP